MTVPLQLTVDGRQEPIARPLAPSSHEASRLFDHAPSIRGQVALDTDAGTQPPELLASDPADWPQCTFCQHDAAEVLRTVEADEGFGAVTLDACRACEQDPAAWDEPGAEIITSASEQR